MVDISDEHEFIVGWAFQPNNETDIDVKKQRGIEAWAVTEELKLLSCATSCNISLPSVRTLPRKR